MLVIFIILYYKDLPLSLPFQTRKKKTFVIARHVIMNAGFESIFQVLATPFDMVRHYFGSTISLYNWNI